MSVRTDIYPREHYESVVVWANQGAGKTQHRELIGQFFGLQKFMDDPSRSELLRVEPGVLYLTSVPPTELSVGGATDVLVIDLNRVLRAIEANGPGRIRSSGSTVPTLTPAPLNSKDTNPKDAVGVAKVPESTVPQGVIAELGVAMMEGALKYGRHNYRIAGVRASVYFDANMRHMKAWWEGEDIDQDSLLSHVTKSIATLVVLRDAMMNGNWVDDRPPPMKDPEWQRKLNQVAAGLLVKYPEPKPAITRDHKE